MIGFHFLGKFEGFKALGALLELNIMNCKIDCKDALEVLPTMPWAGQIQKLDLSNSNIEAGGYTLSVDGIVLECCAAAFGRSDGCDVRATAIRTVPELADSDIANAASVSGSVAVITRGGCAFVEKARRAMAAGAAAVVIVNTDEELRPPGGEGSEDIVIPVVLVAASSAAKLEGGVEVVLKPKAEIGALLSACPSMTEVDFSSCEGLNGEHVALLCAVHTFRNIPDHSFLSRYLANMNTSHAGRQHPIARELPQRH